MAFKVPEHYRVLSGPLKSSVLDGNNGFFVFKKHNIIYRIQASDGFGWEHCSITLDKKRTADWEELCMIKDMFWGETDCVVQYHPPKADHVNIHPYCLHLFRPVGGKIPRPPSIMI